MMKMAELLKKHKQLDRQVEVVGLGNPQSDHNDDDSDLVDRNSQW